MNDQKATGDPSVDPLFSFLVMTWADCPSARNLSLREVAREEGFEPSTTPSTVAEFGVL